MNTVGRAWLVLGVLMVGLMAPFLHEPMTQDSVFSLLAAEKFVTGVDPYLGWPAAYGHWQPPLYWWVLGLVGRLMGDYAAGARLLGIGWALGTLGLVIASGRRMGHERGAGMAAWWAGALYATSPMTIHGAFVAHIDTTILTLGMMGMVHWLLGSGTGGGVAWILRSAGWIASLLCVRWTTPLILPVTVALAAPGSWGRRVLAGVVAGVLGGAVALGLWVAYCAVTGAPSLYPLHHMTSTISGLMPTGIDGILRTARAGLAFAVWMSPFLLLLAAWGTRRMPAWLAVTLWVPLVGYLAGGGQTFGFFKYHAPLVPLLALVGGITAAEVTRGAGFGRLIAIGLGAGAAWFLLGDPLYGLLWKSKLALWHGEPMLPALASSAGWVAVAVMVAATGVRWAGGAPGRSRSATLMAVCAVCAVAWGLALTARQAVAGYQTVYTYGGRGLREAAALIRAEVPRGGRVLAPAELLYLTGDRTSPYDLGLMWYDGRRVATAAADPSVCAVVYGPSVNALAQLRAIEQPEPQAVLARAYVRRDVGDLIVWLRKTR